MPRPDKKVGRETGKRRTRSRDKSGGKRTTSPRPAKRTSKSRY